MPDNVTPTAPVVKRPKLSPVAVVRNGVTLTFEDAEIKKGKNNKGKGYLKAPVTEDNLDQIIKYISKKQIAAMIDGIFRQKSQGWYFEAEDEATQSDGTVDHDKLVAAFAKLATDFSARGDSIPTLKKEIDELTDEMVSLEADLENEDPMIMGKALKRFKEIASEIKDLQLAISLKRRKDDDEETAK